MSASTPSRRAGLINLRYAAAWNIARAAAMSRQQAETVLLASAILPASLPPTE